MPNVNHVTVAGHLGHSPDVNAGGTICKFSLAVNDKPKAGEQYGKSHWLTVKCFGHVITAAEGMVKGQGCHVTGRLAVEEWTGKDGTKKSAVIIIADSVAPYPLKGAAATTEARPKVATAKQPDQLDGPAFERDDGPF